MKINWGTGITIFIIFFLIAMISFGWFASHQDFDLVEEDYYPKELNWDSHMDKKTNNAELETPVIVNFIDTMLEVSFPAEFNTEDLKGEIFIYRPSSKSLDLKYSIKLNDTASQFISAKDILPGRYVVKIDWEFNGKMYYLEQSILKN